MAWVDIDTVIDRTVMEVTAVSEATVGRLDSDTADWASEGSAVTVTEDNQQQIATTCS